MVRWLCAQVEKALSSPDGPTGGESSSSWADEALEQVEGDFRGRLRLRDPLQLHMYVSTAPCGDAAVFQASSAPHRTGAKTISNPEAAPPADQVEAPGLQGLGRVRRKPGELYNPARGHHHSLAHGSWHRPTVPRL